MRWIKRTILGAALTCSLAGAAWAQTAPDAPLPVTPAKLALAQQVVDATGAQRNAAAMLNLMSQQMTTSLGASLSSPDDKRLITQLVQSEIQEVLGKVIASSAQIYAETYSEAELSDFLTFYDSPSGRSYVEKLPAALQRLNLVLAPLIPQIQRRMMQEAFDYICRKQKCTPEQRRQLDTAGDKALESRAPPIADAASTKN